MSSQLEIQDLSVTFSRGEERVYAVTDVTMSIGAGEIIGLVGESGCGKSVTTKAILRLFSNSSVEIGGQVLFDNQNLLDKSEKSMRQIRGKRIALIPQNPLSSLNPVLTIGEQVAEPLIKHYGVTKREAWKKAREMLTQVGFPQGEAYLKRYANEFSGGMRQRIAIAMALISEPDILIADEPTTALDVTIQAQILKLLHHIVRSTNTSLLLITHDLAVVSEMCDKIGVMYAGQLVEWGDKQQVLRTPCHPYTEALIAAIPDKRTEQGFMTIPGQPPKLTEVPQHCHFAERCKYVDDACWKGSIPFQLNSEGRGMRCLKPLQKF